MVRSVIGHRTIVKWYADGLQGSVRLLKTREAAEVVAIECREYAPSVNYEVKQFVPKNEDTYIAGVHG